MKHLKFLTLLTLLAFAATGLRAQCMMTPSGSGCPTYSLPLVDCPLTNTIEIWSVGPPHDITYNVIVPPGHELLIVSGEYRFVPGAGIIVEPGGRLSIQGQNTHLTSCAIDETWEGVLVKGDRTAPSTAPDQGWMSITQGATISRARRAFWHPNSFENGGVIQADEANFINNHQTAQFMSYQGGNSSSSFNNCTIQIDEDYVHIANMFGPGDYKVHTQITSWECDGVRITGTAFLNDFSKSGANPPIHEDLLGDGVGVLDASISFDRGTDLIGTQCSQPGGDRCYFRGWKHGVVSRNDDPHGSNIESLSVIGCKFVNCGIGVKSSRRVKSLVMQTIIKNNDNEKDYFNRTNSTGSNVWGEVVGIFFEGTEQQYLVLKNYITLERSTMDVWSEKMYGIWFRALDAHSWPYAVRRPRVDRNEITVLGGQANDPGVHYEGILINIEGYHTYEMDLTCNHFLHNGNTLNALGWLPNMTFSDLYLASTVPATLDIGGAGWMACSSIICGDAGKNHWTGFNPSNCLPDAFNIGSDMGTVQYLTNNTFNDTPNCTDGNTTLTLHITNDPNCSIPSYCQLKEQGEYFKRSKGKTTIVEEIEEVAGPTFYPNPAQDEVKLSTVTDVTILNLSGQVVFNAKATSTINTSALPNGVYILQTAQGTRDKLIINR